MTGLHRWHRFGFECDTTAEAAPVSLHLHPPVHSLVLLEFGADTRPHLGPATTPLSHHVGTHHVTRARANSARPLKRHLAGRPATAAGPEDAPLAVRFRPCRSLARPRRINGPGWLRTASLMRPRRGLRPAICTQRLLIRPDWPPRRPRPTRGPARACPGRSDHRPRARKAPAGLGRPSSAIPANGPSR